jgi:hypothetical protein
MRVVSWFLGIVLGLIAGGAVLEAGMLALLLLAPGVVWAAREKARPLGLGGLSIGLGAVSAGLLVLANARWAASNVSGPDCFPGCQAPSSRTLRGLHCLPLASPAQDRLERSRLTAATAMIAPAASMPTSTADSWRPATNPWWNSSVAA